jgi:hypothetical protein
LRVMAEWFAGADVCLQAATLVLLGGHRCARAYYERPASLCSVPFGQDRRAVPGTATLLRHGHCTGDAGPGAVKGGWTQPEEVIVSPLVDGVLGGNRSVYHPNTAPICDEVSFSPSSSLGLALIACLGLEAFIPQPEDSPCQKRCEENEFPAATLLNASAKRWTSCARVPRRFRNASCRYVNRLPHEPPRPRTTPWSRDGGAVWPCFDRKTRTGCDN